MKPVRTFTADEGDYSTGLAGPNAIEADIDAINKALDPSISGGGLQTENMNAGAATDTVIGTRTADQAIATATADTGTLTQLFSWIAKLIKGITGQADWKTAPPRTMVQMATDISSNAGAITGVEINVDTVASLLSTHKDSADHDERYTPTASLTKGLVGLGNVDNTADVDKPVSAAQQTALDLKVDDTEFAIHKDSADHDGQYINRTATEEFIPSERPHPATAGFVWDAIDGVVSDGVPDNFLTDVKFNTEYKHGGLTNLDAAITGDDRLSLVAALNWVLNNTEMSASDILTALLTVDGATSGLDAQYIAGTPLDYIIAGANEYGTSTVTDADTITKSGFYRLSSPYTNGPTAAFYQILHIGYTSADYATQIAFLVTSGASISYVRHKSAGVWSEWAKLWNADNDGPGSGMNADATDDIHFQSVDYGLQYSTDGGSNFVNSFRSAFGARSTGGVDDWNDITNIQPGSGYMLLNGDGANGPSTAGAPSVRFHALNFEYSSKTGAGQITQFAIPYDAATAGPALYIRSRYGGTWSPWYCMNQNPVGTALPATTGTMTVKMDSKVKTLTPTGACTLNATLGARGDTCAFVITTSGTSSYIVTWGTGFKVNGTLTTGTVTAKKFVVSFVHNGTEWIETGRTVAM